LLNRAAVGGILGRITFDPRAPLAAGTLEQMLDALAHAQDTSRGTYQDAGIGLGWCARPAAEPMVATTPCSTLRVCSAAALTNADTLRRELADLGHRFHRATDDELILRAYEQWGHRAFRRLRGPFVCAIWEARERRLVVARDHIGIRPLYFAVLPDQGMVFASEIRALLRDPGVRPEWCPAAIDAYLTLGYVPAPLTAYRRISKLEPAHALIVEGRGLRVESYWDLPRPQRSTATERDAIAAIACRLRHAVAGYSAAKRDAALLYSGGTASTALLSTAATSGPVVTVADDQDSADLVRGGRAASMLGRARELESAVPDAAVLARRIAAVCDGPVGDPAAVAHLSMCLATRRHASTALAGHGAATLWGGLARHRVERMEALARGWLRWPLSSISAEIGRSLPESVKGARALTHLAMAPADAYAVKHAYGLWDHDHRRTLYTRRFAWDIRGSNPLERHLELYARRNTGNALDRALYVDAHTFLPDSILPMAMATARAAALDLRFPVLDVDVVESAALTPPTMKQRGPIGMYALRALLSHELPASLMPPARPLPARHPWLRGALAALVPPVLLDSRFDERGIVSRPALRQLWNEHQSGRRHHGHRLWSLLMLELWFRDAIDGNAADVPTEYAILAPRRAVAPSASATLQAA
jgi:asparagine synthase (glutamine-hydrolysing)